jgi:hypothetical protein
MTKRAARPRDWEDIARDVARKIAPWPDPDADTESAIDAAIAGKTKPGAIRVKK